MTTTLELIRGSTTLDISDELNFVHEANDGFGMPPLHRLTERGPLQHGVTDRGFRLDPRVVQLVIPMLADWDSHYTRRAQLLDVLNPVYNQVIHLRFTLPDGSIRQLDCHAAKGPLFATADQIAGGASMRAGFALTVPDPAWYDPERLSLVFAGVGGSGFVIPMLVPVTFGTSVFDFGQTLDYPGDWLEYPEIEITGPLDDLVIDNLTTGETLDFTGLALAAGALRIVDLRYGYKTVVDGSGVNKLADLTSDSDLATWHLEPGENAIQAAGDNATAASRVVIRYYLRYLGV